MKVIGYGRDRRCHDCHIERAQEEGSIQRDQYGIELRLGPDGSWRLVEIWPNDVRRRYTGVHEEGNGERLDCSIRLPRVSAIVRRLCRHFHSLSLTAY